MDHTRTVYDSDRGVNRTAEMSRPEPAIEPRERLNRERVLEAAVALAARDGIESLTMRKLADELGAGAMSLYYHVPNKEQLLDGMVDIVFGEIELPPTDVDWKTAMRKRALSTREALARHRWAIGLMEGRTNHGLANLRLHDAVLGCLRAAGFSLEMTVHAYSVLDAYIYGFALQESDMSSETADDFAAEAQRQMREYEAVLADYPHLVEVVGGYVAKAGYDYATEFLFGLDLILDGLDKLRDHSGA
jgi:AcrR family transcriptional regulator